ncbi:MAG: hypothetical protein M1840_000172 [Geoglossum simile]|nr:MAG: hypothetical protein M1840_000172 [Geoglossum simile]
MGSYYDGYSNQGGWEDDMALQEQADLELAIKMSRIGVENPDGHGQRHHRSSSSRHVASGDQEQADLELAIKMSRIGVENPGGHGQRHRQSSSSRHVASGDQEQSNLELAIKMSQMEVENPGGHGQRHRQSSSPRHVASGGHEHKHHRSSSSRHVKSGEGSRPTTHHSRSSREHHSSTTKPNYSESSSEGGALPSDIKYDISSLKELYNNYRKIVCRSCKSPVGTKVDIKNHCERWFGGSGTHRSICSTSCPKCSAWTCLGCGKKPTVGVNTRKIKHGVADWCCDGGRLVGIWILMARYDELHLEMEELVSSNRSGGSHQRRSSVEGKGIGYGKDDGVYLENPWVPIYDDTYGLMRGTTATKAIKFKQSDSMIDGVLERTLCFICELMPIQDQRSEFDKSPPIAVRALFRLGLLLDKIAELLRNDSINDISARAALYTGVFGLVQKLVSHRGTSGIVTEERHWKAHTGGLQVIVAAEGSTRSHGKGRSAPLVVSGTRSSLASLVQGVVKQSQIIRDNSHEFNDRSEKVTLKLCDDAVTLGALIKSISGEASAPDWQRQKLEDRWSSFHKEQGVMTSNDLPGKRFYYLDQLLSLRQSPQGRMSRLVKEVAEMTTGTPPGILVRTSPDRLDAMKALIIGPEDTPYAGGLFEFDIFPTASYPNEPPKMHFLTTGGGTVLMNPNLYADGHICLSLLGTWEGPPESKWQSKKSTILQVLISIQSMILVEDPWRNEPSNQDALPEVAAVTSRNYSRERQVFTVLYAMIPWLYGDDTRHRVYPGYAVWKDVIDAYFKIHGKKILEQVKKSARDNTMLKRWTQDERAVDVVAKLERALAARGFLR